jgi:membrane protease YdiL (CAAX protease family)
VLLRFFLALFVGAMVLGPILFFALRGHFPFHRVMDRALMISALAALGLAWPRLQFREWWPLRRGAIMQVLLGLLIALLSVQTIIALDAGFGGLAWATITAHERTHIFITALVAALLVPLAEETIFRGFLQTEISRGLGVRWGWFLAALIFALAHFVKIPVELDQQPVHLWSGVSAIGQAFLPVVQGAFFGAKGANLFIIGLILGGTFRRTGTLWFNYGLHGGWIVGLMLATGLTRPAQVSIWTGEDLLSSPLTAVVLLLLGWWLWRFYRRPQLGANAP